VCTCVFGEGRGVGDEGNQACHVTCRDSKPSKTAEAAAIVLSRNHIHTVSKVMDYNPSIYNGKPHVLCSARLHSFNYCSVLL